MRLVYPAHLGLLLLLPVALVGCGSNPAPTETASANTASTTDNSTTDNSATNTAATDNSATDASKGEGKVTLVGDSGLQFTLPPTWKWDGDKDLPLYSSADDAVSVVFQATTDPDAVVKKDLADLNGNEKDLKNCKIDGPPTSGKVDSYDATIQSGTVEVKGTKVLWELDTVKAKTPVVIFTIGLPVGMEDKAKTKDVAEYKTMMDSIKAAS